MKMPDRRPQARNLLIVGQSHVAAYRAAARTHRETFPDEPRTRVIHTLEEVHAPEFEGEADGDHAMARFGVKLAAAITDQIARHDPLVVSVVGGNVHNTLALIQHPRPFDFRLSGEPSPPLDPHAELIPEALVRIALTAAVQPDIARLKALQSLAGRVIQVESPPPVRDEAFIARHAEEWFRARSPGRLEVGYFGLRWRMWRLASAILRDAAAAAEVQYMTVPDEVRDPLGFLRQDYAADPTHGNEAYGAAMIRAIEDFAARSA